FSAITTITRKQIVVFSSLAIGAVALAFAQPLYASIGIAVLLTMSYLANILFRTALVWVGARETHEHAPPPHIPDAQLPRYTVLVPLYREANVLPSLVGALRALDYPQHRLDIKIIVESDDTETIAAAETLNPGPPFEIVCVPPHEPRTKPAACNYALNFARGEFVVIFDAEDRPERDQLRKAVAAFRAAPPDVGCLQARLNFYNAKENWLTVLFALDYSLWFDFLLPGLDLLRVPMPLGGTSNHFRTSVLRAIHGWDAFNVTEDADLGIRLARLGYRAMTLDSTTFEEATNRIGNWVKQRSRWLKGYMQTWLVHMRDPAALFRHAGFRGAIAFQLFIGGAVASALINPLLWCVFIASHIWGVALLGPAYGYVLERASLLSLITGNTLFTYLAMLGPYRRGWLELTPYGLTAPFYWLLISVAAYRALWQLVTRPFHWEKTQHGTSNFPAAS
ncbi:MAG TPA: glycosyltransferase, partial [Rhizomicrobium sp.]|nr:glycosyltransferase [Rhizomicrobium sp.]